MGFFCCEKQNLRSWMFLFAFLMFSVQSGAQELSEQDPEVMHYRNLGIQPLVQGSFQGDFAPGVYLIPHDMIIEKGKEVHFFPGTTILLTQNAMLVINGSLVCNGTKEAPVVFRRLDNRKYFEAIDSRVETRWDGIYLPDSAKLKMNNTIVSESKYGIVISGKNVKMVFDSVRFVNNKFQNVKIGNRIMKISENSPVRFRYPEQEGIFVAPAVVKPATETIQGKKKSSHKTSSPYLRIAMGAAAVFGAAMGVTGYVISEDNKEQLKKTRDEKYEKKANAGMATGIAGSIIFGVGTAGFIWTFFF